MFLFGPAGSFRPRPTSLQLLLCRSLILRNRRRRRRSGLRLCCCLRGFYPRKHGRGASFSGRINGKSDGGEHKDHSRPRRGSRKCRSCASRTKCRLAALSSESCGQIAALPALQQHYTNQKKTDNDVDDRDQNCHDNKTPKGPQPFSTPTSNEVKDLRDNASRELNSLPPHDSQTVQRRPTFS